MEALFRGVSDFSLSCSGGRGAEPRGRRRLFKREFVDCFLIEKLLN